MKTYTHTKCERNGKSIIQPFLYAHYCEAKGLPCDWEQGRKPCEISAADANALVNKWNVAGKKDGYFYSLV